MSISSFIVITLLSNVLRNRVSLSETARVIVADIRTAQANALASKQYNNLNRCGYGLHMLTKSQASTAEPFGRTYYLWTTGASPPSCPPSGGNATYQPSDSGVVTNRILDSRLEMCDPPSGQNSCASGTGTSGSFNDIYFSNTSGTIFVNNKSCPINNAAQGYSEILIRKIGATCPSSSCLYICVMANGNIFNSANPCTAVTC